MTTIYSDEGPTCPTCGRQYTADSDDLFRDTYAMECDSCGSSYTVVTEISTMWICTSSALNPPIDPSDDDPVYVCICCGHEDDPDRFGRYCPNCNADLDEVEKEDR